MGPAQMPKSVGILDDGEDKNGESDEAKLKLLVCVANLFRLDVLPLYNEKGWRVILDLLSTLSLDSTWCDVCQDLISTLVTCHDIVVAALELGLNGKVGINICPIDEWRL